MHDSVFFRKFSSSVEHLPRPKKFTFPFYYTPHSLAINAANDLQQELKSTAIEHNFGFSKSEKSSPIGKMFGVLVVKKADNTLGYIAAFSGKLADKSLPDIFVPPIFNMRTEGSFYIQGEKKIEEIEKEPAYKRQGVNLNDVEHSSDVQSSRTSIGLDDNDEVQLRSNNSYLHDNVD